VNNYLDREANYHQRPSVTVIPQSDFGPGFVRLLEFPTSDEYTDNIVAAWEMQNPPESSFEFAYQLQVRGDEPDSDQFRVLSTTVRPSPRSSETRFIVEYGKPKNGETIPVAELHPFIHADGGGQVKDVQFTPTNHGWLVSFTVFNPNSSQAIDLSCVLLRRDTFCSEKWQYLLNV
jgi:glucans biosynthesis protein